MESSILLNGAEIQIKTLESNLLQLTGTLVRNKTDNEIIYKTTFLL